MPEQILCIYLLVFTIFFLTELCLLFMQYRYLANPPELDPQIADKFEEKQLKSAVNYSNAKLKLTIFDHFYSNFFLLAFILLGLFGAFYAIADNAFQNDYLTWVFYVILITLLFKVLSIPVELYQTFKIEEEYGFNKMTVKLWIVDLIKGLAVSMIISIPILLLVFWFIQLFPSTWWLYAYLAVALLQVMLLYVYPVWIAPIFNKFEPLPEGQLREGIFELSKKLDFPLTEVFQMDASKRSSHGNAYFTGFGKNQRIVLYDTLINDLSTEQLIAVLAHEIGHKKLGHVVKLLVFQLLFMFVLFLFAGCLYSDLNVFLAFGFEAISPGAAIIIFSFLFSPFVYFLTPVISIWQRRFEYQADNYAKEAVGSGEPLKSALIKLHEVNLSNLYPHPWYSFFHHSHPTLVERVSKL